MSHEGWNLGQEIRDGCVQGSRRGQKVAIPAEKAYHINHAHLANAPAVPLTGGGGFRRVAVVVAIPYAEKRVVGGLESGQGVGDGGGDREGRQRRLGEAEVGYVMCQQAHCHAKEEKRKERL